MTKSKLVVASLLGLSGLFAAARTEAANWQICNRTAEPMWAAIAYDPGNGRHVSEGWWKLNSCGGCANVGSYSVRGVWYHAHNKGSTRTITGNDEFCISGSAFRLDNQSACRGSSASLKARGFRFVELRNTNFTSNITGRAANGSVCID